MVSPSDHGACRQCGACLSSQTLGGLCPACVARLTFGLPSEPLTPISAAARAASPPGGGLVFGDFELLGEIGRGGMGVVYRARQRSLGRIVALKMIATGRLAGPTEIERLRAEATAAAALQHPNIVAIHEIGEVGGQHFFTMEYIEGGSLAERVREHPLPAPRAARYVRTIADAVEEAHRRGILHRDLKPSNVLVDTNDQPRVTDFGLAKRVAAPSELTVIGQPIGSPSFMPPEQAQGRRSEIGPHSDVYGLGALLYHLLTGRAPFAAETIEATLSQLLREEPVSPRILNPGVARDLETICLKCLEKEPARRYQTAAALADELGRFLDDQPITARPVGAAEKLWRWARRNPKVALLAASLIVVVAVGLAGVTGQWRRAQRHAASELQQRLRAENALERMQFQRAEELFKAGDTPRGLAFLAGIVEHNPTQRVATARLLSALTFRNFPRPIGWPLSHAGSVRMARFSPDGKRIVTASDDGTARVWEASSGRPVTPPLRHDDVVRCAEFSPDGRSVLTASHDATVRLWDSTTGQLLIPPLPHGDWVRRACFSPNGRLIGTASKDRSGRIWDAQTGALRVEVRHSDYVGVIQFSPDGRWFVTASDDYTARVWDVATGRPVTKPLYHEFHIYDAVFNAQGDRLLTAAHDKTARLWSLPSGAGLAATKSGDAVQTARFSPDGQLGILALWDNTARLIDATTGEFVGAPFAHRANLMFAEFSPDGGRVLTTSDDKTACVWSLAGVLGADLREGPGPQLAPAPAGAAHDARLLLEPMRHQGIVEWASFSPDGERVVTASADHTARIWNIQAVPKPGLILRHGSPVQHAMFSPDGQRLATASEEGVVWWDVNTGRRLSEPIRVAGGTRVQFSGDGQRLALRANSRSVRVWDINTQKTTVLRHQTPVHSISFHPDGDKIVTSTDDGQAQLWDIGAPQVIGLPMSHGSDGIRWAEFSPDGRCILTADPYKVVKIWDAGSHRLLHTLHHQGFVRRVAFSPDVRRVASASDDSTARIWSLADARPILPPLKHDAGVYDVQFSPDGRQLATASADHTAQLWDAQNGQPVHEALRHEALVRSVRFSPDGAMLVTASADDTARLWDTATGLPLSEPLHHGGEVRYAEFAPNGRYVVTVSLDSTARLWPTPQLGQLTPAPGWLPRLAEALAGQKQNAAGGSEPVPVAALFAAQDQLATLSTNNPLALWAHWFLADGTARPLFPGSAVTGLGCVAELVALDGRATLAEALTLMPNNAGISARLARRILASRLKPGERELALADWLSRRALELAPNDSDVLQIHREVRAEVDRARKP